MVPQPFEELSGKAADARGVLIGIIAGGIVLAALLGWLLSGFFVRPVSAVGSAAEKIGEGDLETRVLQFSETTPREIHELGMAFNSMAG